MSALRTSRPCINTRFIGWTFEIGELTKYTVLKKKHSKTGEESRYQGTVLGKPAEDRPVKIEGGPVETLQDWCERLREQAVVAPDSGRSSPSTLKSEGAMRDDEMPNAEMQTAE